MITRYTEEEFNKAKSDDLLKLECENCGEIFYRKKKEIKYTLEHPDRNRCRFCSTKCLSEFNSVEYYNLKCENCGKYITVKSTDFKKSKTKRFFCCNSCAATYNNKLRGPVSDETKIKISESLKNFYKNENNNKYDNKRQKKNRIIEKRKKICAVCRKEYILEKGVSTRKFCSKKCYEYYMNHKKDFLTPDKIKILSESGRKSAQIQKEKRRSKNEIYFCELCKKHFKKVRNNETIFNGWDADIIIDDIKYAVLWNGPWHYKEISNRISLSQIQNRDRIKIKEIEKCGYIPYVIKDMGKYNKSFVEEKFEELNEYIAG